MDFMEAIEALYEYVNAYADSETIIAFNNAYDKFIEWQIVRSNAINEAKSIGEKVVLKYLVASSQ